jgi:hypothetical protein
MKARLELSQADYDSLLAFSRGLFRVRFPVLVRMLDYDIAEAESIRRYCVTRAASGIAGGKRSIASQLATIMRCRSLMRSLIRIEETKCLKDAGYQLEAFVLRKGEAESDDITSTRFSKCDVKYSEEISTALASWSQFRNQ